MQGQAVVVLVHQQFRNQARPSFPPLTTLSPDGARTSSPSHGRHASFSFLSTRTTTSAGISSITSVTSCPMQSRSLPHFGQPRSPAGTK